MTEQGTHFELSKHVFSSGEGVFRAVALQKNIKAEVFLSDNFCTFALPVGREGAAGSDLVQTMDLTKPCMLQ